MAEDASIVTELNAMARDMFAKGRARIPHDSFLHLEPCGRLTKSVNSTGCFLYDRFKATCMGKNAAIEKFLYYSVVQ